MRSIRCAIIVIFAVALLPRPASDAQESILHSFGDAPDGNYPASALVFDRSGNLYGTAYSGGSYGSGVVFKLTKASGQWTESVLYSFCSQSNCPDGSQPYSTLVFDTSGNLYGTTFAGGTYGYGVVFKLTRHAHGAWSESVLHNFGAGTDGQHPLSGVIFDTSGNLYGTTDFGGTASNCFAGCGTAYELSPATGGQWTESILYNFCSKTGCTDGNSPESSLVSDSEGNLFGTTAWGGGSLEYGTVFELSPQSSGQWTQTTIYRFAGGSDGNNPHAGLTIDARGNLYGTTPFGGADGNNGTVFKLTRGSSGQWIEKVLYAFCAQFECSDGSAPYGGVILNKLGKLYGSTSSGGSSGSGVVFELSPSKGHWTQSVVYTFGALGTDGANPIANVILDPSGNIYGTTQDGGIHSGNGVVFEIAP